MQVSMHTVIKTITITVLLPVLLGTVSTAEARLKYYRYNDHIPMVEMTLNMMVAMGVLEPIPSRLVYDGNPYNRYLTSSYGHSSRSPYAYPRRAGYSGRSGFYDDYWDEPAGTYRRYLRSRYGYGRDPWDRYRSRYWDSPWSDPWESSRYATWDSPWADRWDSPRYKGSRSGWGDPWGDIYDFPGVWGNPWSSPSYGRGLSPWSSVWGSQWINPLYNPYSLYLGGLPYMQGYTGLPLLLPGTQPGDTWSTSEPAPEPPAQPEQERKPGAFGPAKTSWSARPSRIGARRGSGPAARSPNYQKLNGLWVDDNGEMLGIRGNRFLWYSNNRYAKGQLAKSPTAMEARIMETRTVVRFHYRLRGNEMTVMSRDGRTRTFNRMPLIEPQRVAAKPPAAYLRYDADTRNLHVRHSGFRPGMDTPVVVYPHLRSRSDRLSAAQRSNARAFAPLKASYSPATGFRSSAVSYRPDTGPSGSAAAPGSTESRDKPRRPGLPARTVARDAAEALASAKMRSKPGPPAEMPSKVDADEGIGSEAAADARPATKADTAQAAESNDPYSYLFSYVRDADNVDGEDKAGQHGSNVWKPNELFPHRRGERVAREDSQPAGTRVSGAGAQKDYVWTQPRPWDW